MKMGEFSPSSYWEQEPGKTVLARFMRKEIRVSEASELTGKGRAAIYSAASARRNRLVESLPTDPVERAVAVLMKAAEDLAVVITNRKMTEASAKIEELTSKLAERDGKIVQLEADLSRLERSRTENIMRRVGALPGD